MDERTAMTAPKVTWWWSASEESALISGPHASAEIAAADARYVINNPLDSGTPSIIMFRGTLVEPSEAAQYLREGVTLDIECGEFEERAELGGDDPVLIEPNADATADLESLLTAWIERHGLLRTFYRLERER